MTLQMHRFPIAPELANATCLHACMLMVDCSKLSQQPGRFGLLILTLKKFFALGNNNSAVATGVASASRVQHQSWESSSGQLGCRIIQPLILDAMSNP